MDNATEIIREHPEYRSRAQTWRTYRDLYSGGEQLRANADRYLIRRQKEPGEVYGERLGHFFYENYAGSIVDWYTATLFRREPVILFDGANDNARRFLAQFIGDCDVRGTSLTEFFRKRFTEVLVYGKSHVLLDFPRHAGGVESRAQEDAEGVSRAYLSAFTPEELTNWSYDEHGGYEWVVLRTTALRKARVEDAEWIRETKWAYFDKECFRIYRHAEAAQLGGMLPWTETTTGAVELVDAGRHGLAKLRRVPVIDVDAREGLWLMNRCGLLQLEHLNKSNALSWALTMGLFAMPVVYSEREWNQMVGESYYIQLGPQDRFGWTEPEGKVYQIAADNLQRLQEEIYRVCYVSQAGGSLGGPGSQSGLSKQRDFAITEEVLRAYGDAVKEAMKRVLRAVNEAREDGLTVEVTGMDEFDIGDFSTELADAKALLGLGMESATLRKQVYKKLALKYLCDSRQETKDRIAAEIEGSVEG
ncbi:MAG TPA: hypothetical protein VFA04_24390 [Bryobacteraceae bacterium]|nr:hypothetical protein [Bryobacteraceae bacterium]